MSSGAVVIEPAAVPVAAAEGLVLGAAAAGVVAVSAAVHRVAEGAVAGPAEYGRALAEAESGAGMNHPVWERVAANVAGLNARIRMAEERMGQAGVPVLVAAPLGLAGQDLAGAARWCARTAQELGVTQKALHDAVADGQVRQVREAADSHAEQWGRMGAVLDRYQEMLRRRFEPTRVSGAPPINVTDAEVSAALLRLDQDANEREQAEVLGAAAVVGRIGSGDATDQLCELQRKVGAVNDAVARRRLAAGWLVVFEEPAVAAALPPDSDQFADTWARLLAVVRGEADLTDELRRDARHAVEAAAEFTRRAYLAAEARSCLADLGYVIGAEFDVRNSTTLTLRRVDWRDHVARVSVTGQGLTGVVLRERRGLDDAVVASDRYICDVFHEALQALGGRVAASEVTVDEHARPPILEIGDVIGGVDASRSRKRGYPDV